MAEKTLKITFSGDTTVYRKEVDKAAVATEKFKKDAGSAMSNLAGVFGINTAAISGSINGISKGFTTLMTSMKASTAGASIFAGAMKVVKMAAISTGIGALIVALGSLVAYFTQTEKGAEFVERAMAGLKAAFKVLTDRAADFGEGLFLIFSGKFKDGWDKLKGSMSGVGSELVSETGRAVALKGSLQDLEDAERDLITVQAERARKISELREQASEEKDAAIKIKLLKEAMTIEKEKSAVDLDIANKKVALIKEQLAMGNVLDKDREKLAAAEGRVIGIQTELNNSLRTYAKQMKGATGEIESQTKAILDKEAARRKELITEAGGKPKQMFADAPLAKTGANAQDEYAKQLKSLTYTQDRWAEKANNAQNDVANNALSASAKFAAAWSGAQTAVVDASGAINSALGDIAVGTGEMLGTFIAGGDGAQSFGVMISTAFADMAITVGKIAIAAGIATLGIKAAFESLNGFAAIAAGIALVALGTAVKGSLKRAASGGAAASASGAGGGNYNYDSRQSKEPKMQTVNVVVSGELKTSGSQLAYIFDKETQRKNAVT